MNDLLLQISECVVQREPLPFECAVALGDAAATFGALWARERDPMVLLRIARGVDPVRAAAAAVACARAAPLQFTVSPAWTRLWDALVAHDGSVAAREDVGYAVRSVVIPTDPTTAIGWSEHALVGLGYYVCRGDDARWYTAALWKVIQLQHKDPAAYVARAMLAAAAYDALVDVVHAHVPAPAWATVAAALPAARST